MKTAFIISAMVHFCLLAATVISFGSTQTMRADPVVALPIELVTIAEVTDVTLGQQDAETITEEAAPADVEAPEPPQPDQRPGASDTETRTETIATDENAIDSPELSAAPAPAADPTPVPEVAEPEPEPEPAPTEVAALPEPDVEPEPPADAPSEDVAVRVPETVTPRRRPPPPPRRQQAQAQAPDPDAFDAQRLSQLINRVDPSGGGSGAAQASLGTDSGRADAQLTLSEKNFLQSQMQRCWNPPIGLAADEQAVSVRVKLNEDGSVAEVNQFGPGGAGALYQVAVDAAQRAVLQCQPYQMPPGKYEYWKDVQVIFDPRTLF